MGFIWPFYCKRLRAPPRTGKEERRFLGKASKKGCRGAEVLREGVSGGLGGPGGSQGGFPERGCRGSRKEVRSIGLQLPQAIKGVASANLTGGKGWVRGKEARSLSACSRRFSAGNRVEFQDTAATNPVTYL